VLLGFYCYGIFLLLGKIFGFGRKKAMPDSQNQ